MTKKITPETLAALPVMEDTVTETPEADAARVTQWNREASLDRALQHHKINGGMLTPAQLIDNAKQFYAYISGETA